MIGTKPARDIDPNFFLVLNKNLKLSKNVFIHPVSACIHCIVLRFWRAYLLSTNNESTSKKRNTMQKLHLLM